MQRNERNLKVEMRKVSDLIPDPKNLKTHPDTQIEHLCASIEEFGFNDPIGIDENNNVIEGHGRLQAAKKLRLLEVPVLVVSGLTDRERIGYAIAHNQTTMNTGLDTDKVREEFAMMSVSADEYPSLGYTSEDVLFMSSSFSDLGNNSTDHNGHERENINAMLPKVHRTVLNFDNEDQYEVWQAVVMACRSQYFTGGSIGERLVQFVDEYEEVLSNGH